MRAAIYLRLSRDSETSTSIERQREACEAFAVARGWEIVYTAEDVDVSGSKVAPWDRPGFAQILARDDVEAILAYRLDRVARSVGDFAALLRRLEERDVAIVSATEPFDLTEPIGKALVYLVAIFAEMEADAIGVRVRSSISRLRRDGQRWSHGRAPYGYRIAPNPDGPGKVLEVDPAEAAVVREIVDRAIAGEGLTAIARDLNARGVPARLGGEWRQTTLRRTLRSDHLLGRQRHKGETLRDADGLPVAPWEPLIDVETFERLGAALDSRSRYGVKEGSRLLSGLLTCDACGRVLNLSGGRREGRSYRCSSVNSGMVCPAPASVSSWMVEPFVEEAFLARFGDLEAVRRVTVEGSPVGLRDLDAQISETLRLLAVAPEGEEGRLLALLRSLKARRSDAARATAPRVEIVPLGSTVRDAWTSGAVDDRRALLADLLLEARVKRGKRGERDIPPGRVALRWLGDDASDGNASLSS